MTTFQKRVWAGLAIACMMLLGILSVPFTTDVSGWRVGEPVRTAAFAPLLVMGCLIYGLVVLLTRPGGSQVEMNERDRRIRASAARFQVWATLGSVFLWTIALSAIYRGDLTIPGGYLPLILASTLVVSLVGNSAGIVIGYWRASSNGES